MKLRAANGTPIRIRGTATVNVFMGNHSFKVTGLVTDHVAEVMLGFDCLKEHNAIWDFKNDQITLDGFVHELCGKNSPAWCRRVVLQSDSVVPSRSEMNLQTKVVFNDLANPRLEVELPWMTEAKTLSCGLRVSRTVPPDGDVDIPVRVVNTKPDPISLKRGTIISELEPVVVLTGTNEPSRSKDDDDPILCEMVSRVDSSVSAIARQRLKSLLEEFSSVFSKGGKRPWTYGRSDAQHRHWEQQTSTPVFEASPTTSSRSHTSAHSGYVDTGYHRAG